MRAKYATGRARMLLRPPARRIQSRREVGDVDLGWMLRRGRGLAYEFSGLNTLFAYPCGRHDARLHRLVAEVGYRAALVLDERLASLTSPPMAILRLGVHEGIGRTRREFLCKIPGWS
jgi:hypothetical protein